MFSEWLEVVYDKHGHSGNADLEAYFCTTWKQGIRH